MFIPRLLTRIITGLWALEESPPITMIPEKAPIAAFTWGTAAGGVPQYLDTLSSGPNGVMVRLAFPSNLKMLTRQGQSMGGG